MVLFLVTIVTDKHKIDNLQLIPELLITLRPFPILALQEDTLGEIRQVESDGCSYLDAISSYHLNRGKVVTKIAKYPHVEDFRQTIVELDEKQVCQRHNEK